MDQKRIIAAGMGTALMLALAAMPLSAQEHAPAASHPENATAAVRGQAQGGFFGAVGRWVDESLAGVQSTLKGTRDRLETFGGQATGIAKDAAGTVSKIPMATVVIGHERCDTAPNGAPDCRNAVAALCRSKGFEQGRSLDVSTAQKCPAQVWLSGRQANPSECVDESFVTRAMCQ